MNHPVRPLMKPPLSWYGGKQKMLKYILPLVPPHHTYVEPYCGGAALFFAKQPSAVEVLNDRNGELMNFYQVLATDFDALRHEVMRTFHSRLLHWHAWYIYNTPQFFTPVQRAWAVISLSLMSYMSKVGSVYGIRSDDPPRRFYTIKEQFIDDYLIRRINKVCIEQNDGTTIITTYDREYAFHFVDPPYINTSCGHYAGMFNAEDFTNLLRVLCGVKGKFMLTMFPNAELEQCAAAHGWHIKRVQRRISAGNNREVSQGKRPQRMQEEWLVMNYEMPQGALYENQSDDATTEL